MPGGQSREAHLGDKDVVGLDVGVQHAAVAQVVQRPEHLRRVRPHRADVQPDAAPVLFGQLPQIQILHVHAVLMRVHRILYAQHPGE